MESKMKQIEPAPVARDVDGSWSHPDLPSFDEGDAVKFQAWIIGQGIEVHRVWMECDAEALHERYCDGSVEAMAEWQPRAPGGPEWFPLAIYDAEDDGPVAYFARAVAHVGAPQ